METTDLPSTEISIFIEEKIKKVYNYQGAPKGFGLLERYIMKVCKVEQLLREK
jgi:hypothetical protein